MKKTTSYMTTIDQQVFNFISKVEAMPPSSPKNGVAPELKGLREAFRLENPENMEMGLSDPFDGSYVSKYVKINEKMMGLPEPVYGEFRELVIKYLDFPPFDRYCNAEYVEKESFNWLMAVYRTGKASLSLSNYLLESLERDNTEHHFYFRIVPLAIEISFKLGKTLIDYFTDEQIAQFSREFLETKPGSTKEEFESIRKEYLDGIVCIVKAKGVFGRAEEIATRDAENAINILKLFFIQEAMEKHIQLFDINFKLREASMGDFINMPEGNFKRFTINFRKRGGNVPVHITKKMLLQFASDGLDYLSRFLFHAKDTKLDGFIKELINQLARMLSTADHYEKIVQSITLIESVVIPPDAKGKSFGETRIKQILPKLLPDQNSQDEAMAALRSAYHIRDRYLHNAQHLPINREKLFKLLVFQRIIIIYLINLSSKYSTLEEVQSYFSEK